MSSSSDTLRFRSSTHGDSILSKMDALREKHHFCDITLLLGGPPGATFQPLHFHGHRVVLAASSDFLRDQFLLHEGRAELSVGVVSSVEIGRRLLLYCYTGLLEVPLRDLVGYLTAASALQMTEVVEKCVQAVSQYLSPSLTLLKFSEKKLQPPDSLRNQEERDAAKPSTSSQEASTGEEEADVIQSRSRVSQEAKDRGGKTEVRDEMGIIIEKLEPSEAAGCCLESEPVHTNTTSDRDPNITGAQSLTLCLPTAARDHILSLQTEGGSGQREEMVNSFQNKHKEAAEDQREEGEMFLLAAQLQDCGGLMDPNLLCLSRAHPPKSDFPEDKLTGDSERIVVHRPYLCRRCDRVFQHLESYVGHLKEHRQYMCLVCGKGFSQRSNLTHHIQIHTGVKLFRCPLCHKTFSQRATLQDHLNLHTGDKPHKCNYCALHFALKPGLRRHLMDIHDKSSLQNVLEKAVD